jgi:hypothetical protein
MYTIKTATIFLNAEISDLLKPTEKYIRNPFSYKFTQKKNYTKFTKMSLCTDKQTVHKL